MKKLLIIVAMLFTVFILMSCNSSDKQTPNDMPNMDVKAENWNTSIKLVDDPMLLNSYKNGDDLTLRVENLSNTPIIFPDDFGIKIITWDGKTWTSVPNNFYNTGQQYLPTKDTYPLGLLASTLPYISNLSSSISIRIVIIGHTEDNDKELLGAYLDIKLNPK